MILKFNPQVYSNYLAGCFIASQGIPSQWIDEGLYVHVAKEKLIDFFLFEWHPSPVISPWNGSTGFWSKDHKKQKDLLETFLNAKSSRFSAYKEAIKVGVSACQHAEASGISKTRLLVKLRNELPDNALAWMLATIPVVVSSGELKLQVNPALGTGGNDSNHEFGRQFMTSLLTLFDLNTGNPLPGAEPALKAFLFGDVLPVSRVGKIGRFNPSATHMDANPWEFLMAIEGARVIFQPGIHQFNAAFEASRYRFPYVVHASSEDSVTESEASKSWEFWAPIW